MRSRTELVTTTFDLDSDEEDYSPDDDDSEEDWRPTNKRRQQKTQPRNANGGNGGDGGTAAAGAAGAGGVGRKRKQVAASAAAFKAKKRALVANSKVSDEDFESADENDDDDADSAADGSDEDDDSLPATSSAKRPQNLPPKKQFQAKLTQLDLLLNKRDLCNKDWLQNSRLCLWRKDEKTNLLQKYLRVKTTSDEQNPKAEQQLLFTSSSVVSCSIQWWLEVWSILFLWQYSSWDEQHLSDFVDVKVNCLDPNNRRIQLADIEGIKKLSRELQAAEDDEDEDNDNDNDENADPPATSREDNDEDEDDEVEEDDDDEEEDDDE